MKQCKKSRWNRKTWIIINCRTFISFCFRSALFLSLVVNCFVCWGGWEVMMMMKKKKIMIFNAFQWKYVFKKTYLPLRLYLYLIKKQQKKCTSTWKEVMTVYFGSCFISWTNFLEEQGKQIILYQLHYFYYCMRWAK